MSIFDWLALNNYRIEKVIKSSQERKTGENGVI